MKVRDLLIKIANGEDLPQKIKINKTIYELNNINSLDELYVEKGKHWYYYNFSLTGFYNDEVEILEEEKKIPMKIYWNLDDDTYTTTIGHKDYKVNKNNFEELSNMYRQKTNEIIDYLDYLKSKGDE